MMTDQRVSFDPEASLLRWFLLPSEAQDLLRGSAQVTGKAPFNPRVYHDGPSFDYQLHHYSTIPSNMMADSAVAVHPSSSDGAFEENSCEGNVISEWIPESVMDVPSPPSDVPLEEDSHEETNISDVILEPTVKADALPPSSNCPPEESSDGGNGGSDCLVTESFAEDFTLAMSICDDDDEDGEEKRLVPRMLVNELWKAPVRSIFKPTLEALTQYKMISNGDRVLVCISGGKDSLSLLHTLRQYQKQSHRFGVSFEMGAMTVDPGSSAYDPSPLIPYMEQLGIPYFYERQCNGGTCSFNFACKYLRSQSQIFIEFRNGILRFRANAKDK